jgi:hypothetical protein
MTRIGALAARSKYNVTRNHPAQGAANISLTGTTGRPVLEISAGKEYKPVSGVPYLTVNNTLQEITSEVRFIAGFKPTTPLTLSFGFSNSGDITSNDVFGVTANVSATASIEGSPEEPISIFTDVPEPSGENPVSAITLSYLKPQASEIANPPFKNSDGFALRISPLAAIVSPANQGYIIIPENLVTEGGTLILLTQLTFQSSLTDGILTQNIKWTLNITPTKGGEEGGKGEKP